MENVMKEIPLSEAVGHVLCHDLTQIIVGVSKDARFRKGHIVTEENIPVLRSLGEFGATLLVAGNIPGRTQTIPMAIYFAAAGDDMHTAWVWVGVITAVSCAALFIMNMFSREKRV